MSVSIDRYYYYQKFAPWSLQKAFREIILYFKLKSDEIALRCEYKISVSISETKKVRLEALATITALDAIFRHLSFSWDANGDPMLCVIYLNRDDGLTIYTEAGNMADTLFIIQTLEKELALSLLYT